MTEQTLLQQARQDLRAASCVSGIGDPAETSAIASAVACILQYLEQRHADMTGPAQVPGPGPATKLDQLIDAARAERGKATAAPDADLAELQRLCDAATSGPWEYADDASQVLFGKGTHGGVVCEFPDPAADATENDANFIAASRDALPKLIAEVRQLRGREVRTAVSKVLQLWNDFTSQEMYGEALRDSLELNDFDEWYAAHDELRAAMRGEDDDA